MAHIEYRISEGIEQVIGKHDPCDLHALACLGYGKEQDARERHERRGEQ